jgi:N-acetylglutamate synthase-like GNAT family acetyltransferase
VGQQQLGHRDLGELGVELTVARQPLAVASKPAATLVDVMAVIRDSCRRRVPGEDLVDEPGLVGVKRGPAAVLWAFDGAGPDRLVKVAAALPDVRELYVDCVAAPPPAALAGVGWQQWESSGHVVFETGTRRFPVAGGYRIEEATAADMAAVRRAIGAAFGLPDAITAADYPDDFLVIAAPARLFVVRDRSGAVVGTAASRVQGRAALLFALTVDAEHRGRGLARALITHAMAAAEQPGVEFLHAQINDSTRALASSLRGVEVARWAHFLREPSSAA